MSFVYNNLAVLYVAIVASLMGWLFGGTRSDVLSTVVPWLMLLMANVIFAFPQKHWGETTYEARMRVWKAIKHDPLFWLAFVFLALMAVPFANKGLCLSCDYAEIAQGHSPVPPISFLPFCVDTVDHYNVFLWFAVALSSLVAVKHALSSSGKRLVLRLIVWNGVGLAVLGFLQSISGAQGPFWLPMQCNTAPREFFSTFGYPNMAGDYFTTLFGLSLALWRDRNMEEDVSSQESRAPSETNAYKIFWRRHLGLIPVVLFYFAAITTLSRSAILMTNTILVVVFLHCLLDITKRMSRRDKLVKGTIAVALVGLVAFFGVISMPDDLKTEVDSLSSTEMLTRVTGKTQNQSRIATKIWRDHVLFGCGGWGYKHFCLQEMTSEELHLLDVGYSTGTGCINVHNDYLQILCEHGLVGFGLLAGILFLLVAPVVRCWKRLVKAARFTSPERSPAKPIQIFALPAPVFFILLTVIATMAHGIFDCPFRSPAILTLFFVSLATLPGFLNKEIENVAC